MGRKADRYFITGTDTGVGKTVLSLIMMQLFYERGYYPFYLKPFQTGCRDPYDRDSDARFIYENVKPLNEKDPADSVIYCFTNPKAPYFAARDEGKENEIDIKVIQNIVNEKARIFNPVIIEGAGGIFVPVAEHTLMIDLIELTESKTIIAARAGLGTINHTLLTIEALKRRDMPPLGVVFIDAGETPTSSDMISENIDAVEKASKVNVAGIIGRIDDFSCPKKVFYQAVLKMGIAS